MLGCTPDSSPPGGFCSRHYRQGTESDFKSTEVRDFPGDPVAETLSSQHRGPGFDPQSLVAQLVKNLSTMQETWVQSLCWKDPQRRERLPTPVFWSGKFHGLYSPWGHKELDLTE